MESGGQPCPHESCELQGCEGQLANYVSKQGSRCPRTPPKKHDPSLPRDCSTKQRQAERAPGPKLWRIASRTQHLRIPTQLQHPRLPGQQQHPTSHHVGAGSQHVQRRGGGQPRGCAIPFFRPSTRALLPCDSPSCGSLHSLPCESTPYPSPR